MKHIKSFNESNEEDLKDFCETHLAYLLDDSNFELTVDSYAGIADILIKLQNNEGFKWNDIKDYFIPFLIQLNKIRRIDTHKLYIQVKGRNSSNTRSDGRLWQEVSFDELIDDELNRNDVWFKIYI